MRIRPWRDRTWWLCGVALATTVATLPLEPTWAGEPPGSSRRQPDESRRVAAIPRPPEPPQPPSAGNGWSPADPDESGGSRGDADPESGSAAVEDSISSVRTAPSPEQSPDRSAPSYPVVVNAPVEALIDHFAARDRERFSVWIARSGRYLGMIQRIFREHGLPEELAYTAMIESGYLPRAVSRVGAKGMWQFMESTARRYGLLINRWVDERLDPVKSTVAAARYLGDLYGMFGHWFLAQAAYNAGEVRVSRAIQRARTSDFWALTQTRHLPDETKMFVPQILAATVITREPVRYGFEVTRESPLAYDEVTVRRAFDLETVAGLAEVSVDQIRDLNPALLAPVTPPFGAYALRLPVGTGPRFEAALQNRPASRLVAWGIHRVGRNQPLDEIARLYRVTPQRLAEVNHLPGGRLRGITELLVPVSPRTAEPTPIASDSSRSTPRATGSGTSRQIVGRKGDPGRPRLATP